MDLFEPLFQDSLFRSWSLHCEFRGENIEFGQILNLFGEFYVVLGKFSFLSVIKDSKNYLAICGLMYKASMIVIYKSRVVNVSNLLVITTIEL